MVYAKVHRRGAYTIQELVFIVTDINEVAYYRIFVAVAYAHAKRPPL
jgi:hypothetical protein